MKKSNRIVRFLLTLLIVLPMLPLSALAATAAVQGTMDFEAFTTGDTLTTANGFVAVPPINKVLEEDGNKFVRMPIAASDTSNVRTAPTNRGAYFQIKHAAFSTTEKTLISVDLRMNGVSGSVNPHIGVWLRKVSYTDANGASQTKQWFHLVDVNLLTGDIVTSTSSFVGAEGASGTRTGATGLKKDVWNTLEVFFDPTDGSFDIYVNGTLYARCTGSVTGTGFTVAADMLMLAVPTTNNASNYAAVADLDDTYSDSNYMDADNFKVATADKTYPTPVWVQDFESASAVTDTVTNTSSNIPIDSSITADATDAGNKVLQWINTPKGTSDYYLWKDRNNNAPLSDFNVNDDGTVTGTAVLNNLTYNVTGAVNNEKYNPSTAATVNSCSGTAATVYIVTGAYADAIGGACGNVMKPLYFKNPAIKNTDVEDFVIDMSVYIPSGTKGKFATQITGKTVSSGATRYLQPWLLTASGTSATLGINTNGEYIGQSAQVISMDEWHRITVVIDKETSFFVIYLDGQYAFACQNKSGSTGNYGYVGEKVDIVANSFFIQANRGSAVADNCGTIQIDNLACYTSINDLDFVLSRENYDEYGSSIGQKPTLGTSIHAGATYEKDPTDSDNIVIKIPFGALESTQEVLLRYSGSYPVQNGYYTVTRNADTNAVEVSGYTVTEASDGTYTITDGTTTYTGLKLGTMKDYCDYWGGDQTVDQNWKMPHPDIAYNVHKQFVFSIDYYLSEDACGRFFVQAHSYYTGTTSKSWLPIFSIDAYRGSIGIGDAVNHAVLTKGAWNNVSASIDLVTGAITLYVNGALVESGSLYIPGTSTVATNLTFRANNINFCKILRKDNTYYGSFSGYVMVDNVQMLPTTSSEVELDSDGLMYVEVNGEKIFSNKIYVPLGTTYTPVYFKASDYAGMLTTESKNSIRLASAAGLRFATRVDTTLLDRLFKLYDDGIVSDVAFGTMIAPTDSIQSEFTMEAFDTEGTKYLAVQADRGEYFAFDNDETTTHFVGSIVDFYESNITRDFSGRGYATVTLRSGQKITVYSAYTQSANVKAVAEKLLAGDYVWTDAQKNMLELFASGQRPPLSERAQQVQDLLGLNVLAIGDSLFQGHTLSGDQQWISLLAQQSYWNLTNLGRNGWTVAYNPDAYADPTQVRPSMYYNLFNNANYQYGSTAYYTYGNTANKTFADVDLILLEGGWNDFGWGLPLGTVNDTDGSTVLGAWSLMIDKLLTDYPNAKIVMITAWHNTDTRSSDGAQRIDFVANAMKTLVNEKYADNDRVNLIDAGDPTVSGIYAADTTWRATYAIDTAHLNADGMKIMAESMLPRIWNIFFGN